MNVTKADGSSEPFSVEKIHKVVEWATGNIANVSFSEVEMNANLSIYDGIETKEIHQVLIKSASDLISIATPNYQYVAARLLNLQLRKEVWGSHDTPPDLVTFLQNNVDNGIYDHLLNPVTVDVTVDSGCWTEDQVKELEKHIDHTRDDHYTYAGLQQMVDKYLVKNRNTGKIYDNV